MKSIRHDEMLSFEETERLCRILVSLGIEKIRITGGEPMVRRDILQLIKSLSGIEGLKSLNITTNGLKLKETAYELKALGVDGLNVSLDTLNRDTFKRLTGYDGLGEVLSGLKTAFELGFKLKINCVPVVGFNNEEAEEIAALAKDKDIDVRFIELMPIGVGRNYRGVDERTLLQRFNKIFGEAQSLNLHGSESAEMFVFPGFKGRVGFIAPMSDKFCSSCNRLRLTGEGYLKLCLYHSDGVDLKRLLRSGAEDDVIRKAVCEAVKRKPKEHSFSFDEENEEKRGMNRIGG